MSLSLKLWYAALGGLVATSLLIGSDDKPRTIQDTDRIAHCIAEMAYQHPNPDRFNELTNAVYLCRLEIPR